ncbi:hypothetical protein BH24ACT3_BH24ACT3_12370 [soil metagenome]
MATPPEQLEFHDGDRAGVSARMADLAQRRIGWLNFLPEVDEDALPTPRVPSLFGRARQPAVPLTTWLPVPDTRKGRQPISIGVQHGVSSRVRSLLAEAGAPVPDGWLVVQDNPRRGLVLHVPDDARNDEVLDWMMRAAQALCPAPFTGHWLAEVHQRR